MTDYLILYKSTFGCIVPFFDFIKPRVTRLYAAVQQQLAGKGEVGWAEALDQPGGIKAAAEQHFAIKSGNGGVCG